MTQPSDAVARSLSPATDGSRRRGWGLAIVCWTYLGAVLSMWLVLQWADKWWPATILMFAPRWLVGLLLVILLPFAAYRRSRSILVLVVAGVIVVGPVSGFNVPWHSLAHSAPSGTPFRVMTLNMHYSKADPTPLEQLIAAHELDLVAIQEWQGSDRSSLNSAKVARSLDSATVPGQPSPSGGRRIGRLMGEHASAATRTGDSLGPGASSLAPRRTARGSRTRSTRTARDRRSLGEQRPPAQQSAYLGRAPIEDQSWSWATSTRPRRARSFHRSGPGTQTPSRPRRGAGDTRSTDRTRLSGLTTFWQARAGE